MNEFFEYATEWQPCDTLFFGDNGEQKVEKFHGKLVNRFEILLSVIQDVLAPKKFTTTVDSVAISEEMSAEGEKIHVEF